ncbi:prophage tail fiber N-terminal domain-containing protein [Pectobacterium punjabense]|uniref:phage tail fiber protein n=1 Tax=Pectobacterium punjabense TaxID=2108399 RepID=UPI00240719EE|nr:prophage tail fiber N-terminal domain-containing protein [Pectobacterium punjabense]MDG0795644.1 prophage tail fiber N-terminal domain-containing protein [Pectobacterium punjabense]
MSVLISGVLINPAGEPIPDAEITFTALTTSNSVLNGFSASVMTNDEGEYSIPLEHCVYSISIQNAGYNSIYGSVSINEKSTPTTINELLKLATMEQAVTPAIIVYFREIQADVAAKLVTMQTLSTKAAEAASAAAAARDEASQYAQNLSAAVAQAQQASAAAAASANAASNSANGALVAKNAAEVAAGNAKATLAGVMKKSANGADIENPEQFRTNLGLKDAVLRGEFGVGGILDLRGSPLIGPPSAIYGKGTVFGFCAGSSIDLPDSLYVTLILNGSWENVTGITGISRVAIANGTMLIQQALADDTWSEWVPSWNAISLPNPMQKGEFGWGGRTQTIVDANHETFFNATRPSGVYAIGGDTSVTKLPVNDGLIDWKITLIGDGRVFGILEVTSYFGSSVGNKYIRPYSSTTGWGDWRHKWDSQNLAPVTTNTEQSITGRKTFSTDWAGIILQPNTEGGASYLQGSDFNGNTTWFIGRQNSNSNTVILYNTRGNCGAEFNSNGGINFISPGNVNINGEKIMRLGEYGFGGNAGNISVNGDEFLAILKSGVGRMLRNNLSTAWQDEYAAGILTATQDSWAYFSASPFGGSVDVACGVQNGPAYKHRLWTNRNTTIDANGFIKTASPIVKLFADGTSELNAESEGVVTERVSTGVYKISGCLGFNADPLWGGIDGGVEIPLDINKQPLIWVNSSVESDGSIIINTHHRTYPDSPTFAQNNIDGVENGQLVDIPAGRWIDVRVQMPQPVIPRTAVLHSNVYCGSVQPAGDTVLQ